MGRIPIQALPPPGNTIIVYGQLYLADFLPHWPKRSVLGRWYAVLVLVDEERVVLRFREPLPPQQRLVESVARFDRTLEHNQVRALDGLHEIGRHLSIAGRQTHGIHGAGQVVCRRNVLAVGHRRREEAPFEFDRGVVCQQRELSGSAILHGRTASAEEQVQIGGRKTINPGVG